MEKISSAYIGEIEIYVDKEGNWYYKGIEATREDIVKIFMERLVKLPNGKFGLKEGEKVFKIDVEDTPFVATGIKVINKGKSIERIFVKLKWVDEEKEIDPASIRVGKDNVLYFNLKDSDVKIRLLRPAYMELANFIHEDENKGYYIEVSDKRYYLTIPNR